MFWEKYNKAEIESIICKKINNNKKFNKDYLMSFPSSTLNEVLLKEEESSEPFAKVLSRNPNHIGYHIMGDYENAYRGTQSLEKEVLDLCATEVFLIEDNNYDAYVTSGGTEGNIQALWIYRNYFLEREKCERNEIGVIFSQDTHYSIYKACNLLGISSYEIGVRPDTRKIIEAELIKNLEQVISDGIKFIILVANMGTTMFGSVDDIRCYQQALDSTSLDYIIHIDAAFGGFIYPFTADDNKLNFKNSKIVSICLDGHKMLRTPIGSGVFIIRSGYMKYVKTKQASYIPGTDYSLLGSRSGANAVAMWIVLREYGSNGLTEYMKELEKKTLKFCEKLKLNQIRFFHEKGMNIVAIDAKDISNDITQKYYLVPNNYDCPEWWKIIVMPHVGIDDLMELAKDIINNKGERGKY